MMQDRAVVRRARSGGCDVSGERVLRAAQRGGSFLVIGGIAFLIDAAVFNLLAFGFTGHGLLFTAPLIAKAIAIAVATVFTYVGNRFWTYRARPLERRFSRYAVFVAVNLIAIGLQLGCLAFSRYVLGLHGVVPDNVSGTIIGQAVATIFRFVAYDRWVFTGDRQATADRADLTP